MYSHNHILTRLYKTQFLNRMPEQLQALDDTNDISMIEEPDIHRAVFIRVIGEVLYPVEAGSEQILLERQGIYALRYSAISTLLEDGKVELI